MPPFLKKLRLPTSRPHHQCAVQHDGREVINALLFSDGMVSVVGVAPQLPDSAVLVFGRALMQHVRKPGRQLSPEVFANAIADPAERIAAANRLIVSSVIRGTGNVALVYMIPDRDMPLAWINFQNETVDEGLLRDLVRALIAHHRNCRTQP